MVHRKLVQPLEPEATCAQGFDVEGRCCLCGGTEQGHELGEYYTAMSGTSMATPHVAGVAAILAQRHPTGPASN